MRRFVNIVAENYKSGTCSLHRLDVSKHLFYPSAAEADDAAAARSRKNDGAVMPTLERLPPPCIRFEPSTEPLLVRPYLPFFALVSPHSSKGGRIITCDNRGHSILYDADSHSNRLMPTMQGFTGFNPTAIISTGEPGAQEEDLFVLHSGFHVLRFGPKHMEYPDNTKEWRWERLPRPPIHEDGAIRSHTVIDGGRTICISSQPHSFGTCCFDTVEREWWHAGSWVLPFMGGAEYVPSLGVWLGFSPSEPHPLCVTSDLSAMEQLIALGQPPAVQHVLQDLDGPKNWFPLRCNLLNLGGGMFCVARVFQEVTIDDTQEDMEELDLVDYYCDYPELLGSEFAVLTGIELITCASGVGLRIHKSLRYSFTEASIKWTL